MSKQARVRLIHGKSELQPGMDIIKKLDSALDSGGNQFKDGQSEWAMATFNEKHRWVWPLVPTACAYAKLSEYFGKLRGFGIEVPKAQGDFGWNLSVRGFLRAKHHRLQSKMGIPKRRFQKWGYGSKYDFASCKYHFGLRRGSGKPGKRARN